MNRTYREMPPEVRGIVEGHERWLETDGREGIPAVFRDMDLTGISFRDAALDYASFRGCNLGCTDFTGASLRSAMITSSDMGGAVLDGVRGERITVIDTSASSITVKDCDMPSGTWINVGLENSDIRDSCFDCSNMLNISLEGMKGESIEMRDSDLYAVTIIDTQVSYSTLEGCRVYVTRYSGVAVLDVVDTSGIIVLDVKGVRHRKK